MVTTTQKTMGIIRACKRAIPKRVKTTTHGASYLVRAGNLAVAELMTVVASEDGEGIGGNSVIHMTKRKGSGEGAVKPEAHAKGVLASLASGDAGRDPPSLSEGGNVTIQNTQPIL